MTTPIRPYVDEHGVPWCTNECPRWSIGPQCMTPDEVMALQNSGKCVHPYANTPCIPAVSDLAAEVAAFRELHDSSKYACWEHVDAAMDRTDAWRKK